MHRAHIHVANDCALYHADGKVIDQYKVETLTCRTRPFYWGLRPGTANNNVAWYDLQSVDGTVA